MQSAITFYPPAKAGFEAAASAAVGGLSAPSKMPGPAWSTPATACRTGTALRGVPGSTCSSCYALRGNYVWPSTKAAMARRLQASRNPRFADLMAQAIRSSWTTHFRWFDSGDLADLGQLFSIVRVAELLPSVQFWLPTREYDTVREYLATFGEFPPNLTVRLSAHLIGHPATPGRALASVPTSTVRPRRNPDTPVVAGEYLCPAPTQGGKCQSCRACWDRRVAVVSYIAH